jgi:UTP--glucose-1-phosphate uridylyltransferase
MEVDESLTHLYGIATVEATKEDDVVVVKGLVEKPASGTAPSNFAVIGRYVLQPEVFPVLDNTQPGAGGEIQLTDALQELAHSSVGGGVLGVVFRGRRYDTGDRLDYLKAIVQVASSREDLGPEFLTWLADFSQNR